MRHSLLLIIAGASLSAIGCSRGPDLETVALKAAKQNARDPDSVTVRNVRLQKTEMGGVTAICGEVNAKNGFGGMSGWTNFGVEQDGSKFYTVDRKPYYTDNDWAERLEYHRHMCDDVW